MGKGLRNKSNKVKRSSEATKRSEKMEDADLEARQPGNRRATRTSNGLPSEVNHKKQVTEAKSPNKRKKASSKSTKVKFSAEGQGKDNECTGVTAQGQPTTPVADECTEAIQFEEGENMVSMEVSGPISDRFPSKGDNSSDDERDQESRDEAASSDSHDEVIMSSQNNNASLIDASRDRKSRSRSKSRADKSDETGMSSGTDDDQCDRSKQKRSSRSRDSTFMMMRDVMISKGLIDSDISEEEIRDVLRNNTRSDKSKKKKRRSRAADSSSSTGRSRERSYAREDGKKLMRDSPSESTIYRNAVKIYKSGENQNRKSTSSSEGFADTSDELLLPVEDSHGNGEFSQQFNRHCVISDDDRRKLRKHKRQSDDERLHYKKRRRESYSRRDDRSRSPLPQDYIEENDLRADQVIKEAEHSKARMFNVPGKSRHKFEFDCDNPFVHSAMVDQKFLIVAVHIKEGLRRKIQNFEYVDFAKLLP